MFWYTDTETFKLIDFFKKYRLNIMQFDII